MIPLTKRQIQIVRGRLYTNLPETPGDILITGPSAKQHAAWVRGLGHRVTAWAADEQDFTDLLSAGIDAVREDPTATGWPANSFHVVVALTIPHFPSGVVRNPYLREAVRVTRSGGYVLWTTTRFPNGVHAHYKR